MLFDVAGSESDNQANFSPDCRVVLAAASPYFRAMFTSGFEDASKRCIPIKGVSKVIMLQVLKFAYSGKVRRKLNRTLVLRFEIPRVT